ncbi:MAG TPA: helix-turn-helix domain-containing protein, partial [Propionibacteriaceae bacterium]|nr:helix-turn-helix domain-containing protein [Propionibacteriaceae bacterium]
SEVRVDTQPRRERERLCLPTRTLPSLPKAAAVSGVLVRTLSPSAIEPRSHEPRADCAANKPKLSAKQQTELRRMHTTGDYSIADLAELFNIGRATVYRTLRRQATSES